MGIVSGPGAFVGLRDFNCFRTLWTSMVNVERLGSGWQGRGGRVGVRVMGVKMLWKKALRREAMCSGVLASCPLKKILVGQEFALV